VVVVTTWKNFR